MEISIPFFNKKRKETYRFSDDQIPNHVAIIMDGNGRWAKKRGMPRMAGHKEGVSAVVKTVRAAVKYKVKVLTLFAFSTENWKRPKVEVDSILRLPNEFLKVYLSEIKKNNVRINVIGDIEKLPTYTREALQEAVDQTCHNDGLQLNIALNYGGRYEILHGMKEVLSDIMSGKITLDELSEEQFSSYLYTIGMKDPDLLIRTGGEKRLSNFLLWQMAYTEFCFTDVLWPDFSEKDFQHAMKEYQQRKRRFGGV